MRSHVSSRLVKALAALAMVLGGVFAFAPAAEATTTCPLHYAYYAITNNNAAFVDSYGTWANPDIGFVTKVGGTTCGGNVYVSNLIGPSSHSVLVRVWYEEVGGAAHSHTPVSVPMSGFSPGSSTLYNLGPVPTGDIYIIEVLSRSLGASTGAGCLNTLNGGIVTPCFDRERG